MRAQHLAALNTTPFSLLTHTEAICDTQDYSCTNYHAVSRALWQDVLIAVHCHNVTAKLGDGFGRCNFFLETYDNKNNLRVMQCKKITVNQGLQLTQWHCQKHSIHLYRHSKWDKACWDKALHEFAKQAKDINFIFYIMP